MSRFLTTRLYTILKLASGMRLETFGKEKKSKMGQLSTEIEIQDIRLSVEYLCVIPAAIAIKSRI